MPATYGVLESASLPPTWVVKHEWGEDGKPVLVWEFPQGRILFYFSSPEELVAVEGEVWEE